MSGPRVLAPVRIALYVGFRVPETMRDMKPGQTFLAFSRLVVTPRIDPSSPYLPDGDPRAERLRRITRAVEGWALTGVGERFVPVPPSLLCMGLVDGQLPVSGAETTTVGEVQAMFLHGAYGGSEQGVSLKLQEWTGIVRIARLFCYPRLLTLMSEKLPQLLPGEPCDG